MASGARRNIIHVTGFDVFDGFESVNPSWAAVSLLPTTVNVGGTHYCIQKHKVPVTYTAVDTKVPELWTDNPALVVHCGVHRDADKIHLEKHAHNRNFVSPDWKGECLNGDRVCLTSGGVECQQLSTKLDLDTVVSEADGDIFKCTEDPGSFLCGYIYLKSLDVDNERCLFIHVPRFSERFTSQTISDGILFVIEKCLKQLAQKN